MSPAAGGAVKSRRRNITFAAACMRDLAGCVDTEVGSIASKTGNYDERYLWSEQMPLAATGHSRSSHEACGANPRVNNASDEYSGQRATRLRW